MSRCAGSLTRLALALAVAAVTVTVGAGAGRPGPTRADEVAGGTLTDSRAAAAGPGGARRAEAPAGPREARPAAPVEIVQDRVYRSGPLLFVDAVVANGAPQLLAVVQVAVEFLDFFGDLLSVEDTLLRPVSLGPGQRGGFRVVTPFHERLRRVRYRFTWQDGAEQRQVALEREVWALGAATRPVAGSSR